MRIEILCTGDEILTGKTVNTNYSHMAQRLEEVGLSVLWGTTVGDDRESLLAAARQASERADAVIVNGGLGPTVDDLSQEIAGQAAGVDLVLNEGWLAHMQEYYSRRNREMPEVNRKQAMLPYGAEVIDNPIGTACGFAVNIGAARFYFTPGVPRELRKMLDEQLLPRLLKASGLQGVTLMKRFHSFGIGESRADELLRDVETLAPNGGIKLGFQSHYPQLETKLVARGENVAELEREMSPVIEEVRRRYGNFIVAEDVDTIETVILSQLKEKSGSVAFAEMFTSGNIAARIAPHDDAGSLFLRGVVARDLGNLLTGVGLDAGDARNGVTKEAASEVASALQAQSGASHALAVLVDLDEGEDKMEFGGKVCIGIASHDGSAVRQARLMGGRQWVRLGAGEMGLDCLRRYLLDLPVDERVDFEKH